MLMARRADVLMSMILLIAVGRKDGMNQPVLMVQMGVRVVRVRMTVDEWNDGHPQHEPEE